ncbi:trypsin-like peptidase domain-containing protein [Variovorax sp. Sphag1AA]|uniref:trypsin-like peptidase domain-containing protein n=1 Tax=Variovorax sp. Sphag1AA TaxID=2587027 RepID=UPI00161CA851|nr:trypsin-like peptidase domain-containing protein [Variovorax sp. Sphag1AA]MBB3176795.1 serine protease Do [Variovorax sp. Sphag1AA]
MHLPRFRVRLALLALGCLLGACASEGPRSTAQFTSTPASAEYAVPTAPAFSSLVASRRASVVDISTLAIGRQHGEAASEDVELEFEPEMDFSDQLARPLPASARISQIRDLASGVTLSSDGLILTAAHVVANVDEIRVRLDDGRIYFAHVVGIDRPTDVGLLKIDAKGLTPAPIGDSSTLSPGDWVAAIGAPFGFHGSVTAGVVSAVDRFIGAAGVPYIQTDVAINPGSSGSPLFNSRGEVVGINSLIYSGSGGFMGLSFSVPINAVIKVASELKATGYVRRARIGAEFQEVTPALAQAFGLSDAAGALVVRVDARGPAQGAGLKRGDVVTALDGVPVARFTDLLQRIATQPPRSRHLLDVWRDGGPLPIQVTLSESVPRESVLRPDNLDEWADGLGLTLGELPITQRAQFGIDGGLMVREAVGAARSEGLRPGDIVVALNGARLDHVDDYRRAVAKVLPGRNVALLVMRDRRLVYVAVRRPSLAEVSVRPVD